MKKELLKFGAKATFVFFLVVFAMLASSVFFYEFVVKPADEDSSVDKTYSVQGYATRKVTPDTATITVGTILEDTNIVNLQNKANEKVSKAITDIKALGIKEEDIQTSEYSVEPDYDSAGERIIGYKINISVKVTIKNTNPEDNLVSDVMSKAIAAGLNEVRNLAYSVEDEENILEELKLEAIDKAKEKAEEQSDRAGLKLGDVTNVVESGYYPIYGYDTGVLREESAEASPDSTDSGSSIQIQPGQFELSSYVTVTFEIK
ncbi:MAG: Orf1 protein [candidate division WS6 bacterium GW2011_GWA2_37_6]|uniref:Orf1 protein n=1 Tax=candidate division WS6 bacterium GW2011_GWA2_37_6 TaxID=1619087 RepID=A0A0G0H1V8_9BACT|nr:MAG: Orf1 protein [candidate division WS6 bacterium GW2011_GWA2_37_6]